MKLVLAEPALRSRLWEHQLADQQAILEAFEPAERTFDLEVVVSAVHAASTIALINWATNNANEELPTVLARAFQALRAL